MRSRCWRFVILTGFVVSMTIFVVMVASYFVGAGYFFHRSETTAAVIYVAGGAVGLVDGYPLAGFQAGLIFTNSPVVFWLPIAVPGEFVAPLWIPFAAVALPTIVLLILDRRPRPGQCRQCRYNLTGNTSGMCPECGTAIARE